MKPYGSWKSPITSDLISTATINFHHLTADDQDIYWIEWRPTEAGRYCLVKYDTEGQTTDVTPKNFNIRTRVHEYGGAAYTVDNGTIYFSNYFDQHLYVQVLGNEPKLLVAENGMRYADSVVDRKRKRLICVREDHCLGGKEAVNTIVSIALAGKVESEVLTSGHDFYANPRISADGKYLAWLSWCHPNMPWDGCQLWVGELNDQGKIATKKLIAGSNDESIFQPEWSADGSLYFISDKTGWCNLYRWQNEQVESLCPMQAEFGRPQWHFGYSTYTFISTEKLICSYAKNGSWHLAVFDLKSKKLEQINTRYKDLMWLRATSDGRIVFRGGSPTEPASIVTLDLVSGKHKVIKCSTTFPINSNFISIPEAIEFPTENGFTAHAFFYKPQNQDYLASEHEKPPLLVKSHGGPTGATTSTLNLEIQYWTSRGIAVLDVNYGGSTGYGRAYSQRLHGAWGIVDVDDCVNGAQYLIKRGDVDGKRLIITGGSAGGYTTLCALTFRNVFKCGASYYGVSDLDAFAKDTHKFESRYLDKLIGPYPKRKDLYIERSPIYHVDKLSCPIIFFQGLEDKVVPPNQAEMMVEALRKKNIPVAYITFPGEQHGLRKAETVKRALDAELYFYGRILGFLPADYIEPIVIENWKDYQQV